MCFLILFLPGMLLASYMLSRFDMRVTVLFSAALTAAGCWVRYLSTAAFLPGGHVPYALLLVGQCMAAVAQPLLTNVPAKLAETWFPQSQRDIATTIGALFNPLGNAVGSVIASILVSSSGSGMGLLLLVEAAAATAITLLVATLFSARPKLPPSVAASTRSLLRAKSVQMTGGGVAQVWSDAKLLLGNGQFLLLMLGFGTGLGLFNSVLTLVEQMVKPAGYGSSDAGMFSGVVIGAGLLSAAAVGPLMDYFHAYKLALKAGIIVCVAGAVVAVLGIRPGQLWLATTAFALLGASLLPMLPVTLANAVECTYPVPEEASGGMLLFSGQLTGIVFIFLLSALLDDAKPWHTPWTDYNLVFIGTLVAAAVPLLVYNGKYKRLEAERAAVGVHSPLTGGASASAGDDDGDDPQRPFNMDTLP